MSESETKRKTRSNKFPLTLHKTRQYCKKIRGRLHYFGTDKKAAQKRYLEQATYLHAGKTPKPSSVRNQLYVKTLCNLYLDHQESRAAVGAIKIRHLCDQTSFLRDFVRFVGSNRDVADISTLDLQDYRKKLIKAGKAPYTVNNRIAPVKAMYNWAVDNEIIEGSPRLKAIKKIPRPKRERPTYSISEIQALIAHANPQMKAMIWVGLNCGFGCTDCAELEWKHLDLENGRVNFPRGKTGIGRNLPLWPETMQALKDVPKSGELVFCTSRGNPWVRTIRTVNENGTDKYTKDDAVSKEFAKLMKKAGIKAEKGVGFYTLRRTAATLAAHSGDPFAVQKLLGHADYQGTLR